MKRTLNYLLIVLLMLLAVPAAGETALAIRDDFIVLHPGETVTIELTQPAAVTWSADDPSVVRLDADGGITALRTGLATVTAERADTGESVTAAVTVVPDKSQFAEDRVRIAVQLYNFQTVTGANDPRGIDVLRSLAAMGYDGVEWFSGNFNLSAGLVFGTDAETVASWMRELGLESAGLHYPSGLLKGADADAGEPGAIREETLQGVIRMCETLGITLLWPQTSYPMATGTPVDLTNLTAEQIDARCDTARKQFARYREILSASDIHTMYHNHAELYRDSSGAYGLDSLGSDGLQIDYYWLVKGLAAEEAALAFVRERAAQIVSLHIKDGTEDILSRSDYTSWGKGTFDIPALIDIAREYPNIEWVVAENDGAMHTEGGPLEDARITMDYIRQHLELTRNAR